MIGQYEIKVGGLFMGQALTYRAALALVTLKFHDKKNVTIEKRGRVVWASK